MRYIAKIMVWLFVFITYSCKQMNIPDLIIDINNSDETRTLSGQLVLHEIMESYYDLKISDSILFLTTSRGEHAIKAYSIKDFKFIDGFGYTHDGPESVNFPMFIKYMSNPNKTELYDINRRTLINVLLNEEDKTYFIKKKLIPESMSPCLNLNKVSDSTYFANGLPPFNQGLYFRWDASSLQKEWMPYFPDNDDTKNDEEKTALYRNTIIANNNKSILICAMKHFNRIFAFDFEGNIVKDIQIGEGRSNPTLDLPDTENFTDNSEIYFIDIAASDSNFYCLLNNRKVNSDRKDWKNSKILVFDWELNYIETIQTNQIISCIDVDLNDSFILGTVFDNEEDTSIFKFDLK